jgi:hypothetical protein
MTLIDLYVAEVGRRLPRRSRADIEAELRSTLEDMLEDRSHKEGRAADDQMMKDLLRQYGPPDRVAATYHAAPYLIGPRIYPFFVRVLRIVLTVLTAVLLVTLGIRLATQPLQGLELARAVGQGLLGIVGAAVQAFGNLVLVFVIIERVMPSSEFKFDDEKKEWDPADLVKEARPTDIKPWDPIASIVLTAAAMIVLNGYPQLLAAWFYTNGQWLSTPVLTQAFFRWLPYLNVLWALQIGLNLMLLRYGQWTAGTKWARIALDLGSIAIGYGLLTGPTIVSLSPAAVEATGLANTGSAASLNLVLTQAVRMGIAVVVIVKSIQVVREAARAILKH